MSLKALIYKYLKDVKLMQLATTVNKQPWICSVWFCADKDLNIYFFSSINRRHSKEILKNNKVAAAFALPQTPKDKPRGLQLQGTASEVKNKKEISKATILFTKRIFSLNQIQELMNHRQKPHRFYKITPSQYVLFDALNFPDESRQEFNP